MINLHDLEVQEAASKIEKGDEAKIVYLQKQYPWLSYKEVNDVVISHGPLIRDIEKELKNKHPF